MTNNAGKGDKVILMKIIGKAVTTHYIAFSKVLRLILS